MDCIYQVKSRFCLYQVTSRFCLYQVTSRFCLYQVTSRFCLYQVVFFYSRCSSIHTSVRGAASAWAADTRLSSDCDGLRETHLLGDGARWGRLVSPISTTVVGWVWRPKAAASGRAASIATLVSGRWARGNSGYTIPGLSLIASPASRVGQVIWGLAGRPEKGLVQGCSREGEEKPDPELFTLVGVVFKSCLESESEWGIGQTWKIE